MCSQAPKRNNKFRLIHLLAINLYGYAAGGDTSAVFCPKKTRPFWLLVDSNLFWICEAWRKAGLTSPATNLALSVFILYFLYCYGSIVTLVNEDDTVVALIDWARSHKITYDTLKMITSPKVATIDLLQTKDLDNTSRHAKRGYLNNDAQ